MSLVTVLQPPDYANEHFELTTAEGLGIIVFCKKCEVAVLVWQERRLRWICPPDDLPATTYTIPCWSCSKLVHRPSTQAVRRFQHDDSHVAVRRT